MTDEIDALLSRQLSNPAGAASSGAPVSAPAHMVETPSPPASLGGEQAATEAREQAPLAPPKDAIPRWAAVAPAQQAAAPAATPVPLPRADEPEGDIGAAAEMAAIPPRQVVKASVQAVEPPAGGTRWEGVEALKKMAQRPAADETQAPAAPRAGALPATAPPPAAPRSSVDIDALLADIMDEAAAKAAAEKPDPEAERRAAQKRRQEEFAARQKQVERSIQRERRRIKMSRERLVIEWLAILLGALVVVFLLTQFVFVNAEVPTESMEDTINVGDRVLGYRLAYLSDAPQRGEIVIFHYPDDERQLYVKRIAGLPGEELEIRDGIVYINGVAEPTINDHIKDAPQGNFGPYTVPADSYFMLGDNRDRSWDSRYWKNTFVTFEQIVGKATHRFYPSVNKLE